MAKWGGYLGRRLDSAIGHQTIWEGYSRLATIEDSYQRLIRSGRNSRLHKRLSPK